MSKKLPTLHKHETLATLDLPKGGVAYLCRVGIEWWKMVSAKMRKGRQKHTTWMLYSRGDVCTKNCRRKDCPGPIKVHITEDEGSGVICEGKVKKGCVNKRPTIPRPLPLNRRAGEGTRPSEEPDLLALWALESVGSSR